jgi:hypothetical protein
MNAIMTEIIETDRNSHSSKVQESTKNVEREEGASEGERDRECVAVPRRGRRRGRDCEGKVRLRLSRNLFSFFLLVQISLLFATSIFCVLRKKHRPLEMALAQPAAKKDDDREDDGEVTLFVPDLSIYLSIYLPSFNFLCKDSSEEEERYTSLIDL